MRANAKAHFLQTTSAVYIQEWWRALRYRRISHGCGSTSRQPPSAIAAVITKHEALVENNEELLQDCTSLVERIGRLDVEQARLHKRSLIELKLQSARLSCNDLDIFSKQHALGAFQTQLRTFLTTLNESVTSTIDARTASHNIHPGFVSGSCRPVSRVRGIAGSKPSDH